MSSVFSHPLPRRWLGTPFKCSLFPVPSHATFSLFPSSSFHRLRARRLPPRPTTGYEPDDTFAIVPLLLLPARSARHHSFCSPPPKSWGFGRNLTAWFPMCMSSKPVIGRQSNSMCQASARFISSEFTSFFFSKVASRTAVVHEYRMSRMWKLRRANRGHAASPKNFIEKKCWVQQHMELGLGQSTKTSRKHPTITKSYIADCPEWWAVWQ